MKTNEVNANLDTTTSQELGFPPDFPEKRIVYQIPEMKEVICHDVRRLPFTPS